MQCNIKADCKPLQFDKEENGLVKRLIIMVCCFAVVLSLTACSTGFGSLKYTETEESNLPSETFVVENSKYKLQLDQSNMGFILTEKSSGKQWNTSSSENSKPQLDEFGMPIKKHPRVESILSIECKDFNSNEMNSYYSYTDSVQGGKVTYEPLKNGILLNFYFSEAKVMIPLECTLTDIGLKLSVNPKKIMESDNKVVSISIAPFFCGVQNDTKNSYLFVPSGSGALVGTGSKSAEGDSYSAQIYGYDPSIDEVASISTTQAVRLNVFGVKTGDRALCAIVDSSPQSAWINATSGSTTFGYSSCYATFQMRGYTNHIAELYSYERVENVVYSKKMINKPVSVIYCPLSGDNADYSGMANIYRDYLIKTYGMEKSSSDIPLNIRILGGTTMTKSLVGIPYETIFPTTTLSSAKAIMDEIKAEVGTEFSVQLKGFGESGVDVGKIAGNYAINDNLGSFKTLKELFDYSKNNNISLYFDFDIERYNTGSSGVSEFFDSATNAGEQKALQYYYDVAVRDKKQDTAYYLLAPKNFKNIFDKVAKKTAEYNINGISLDTLSSTAYSDYADKENSKYYSKNGFVNTANSIIKSAKSKNNRFMASSANLYSAVMADIITESPVNSEKNRIFLYDVPFYQMVFKGSIPITVESINLAADTKLALLKAIESGSGLGYTVIDNWDNSVINADLPYFYNSVFKEVKNGIFDNSKELSDYYNKISGKHIVKHTVYDSGLRETIFENGVCVYVNYTGKSIKTPKGELLPYEYLITEKSL